MLNFEKWKKLNENFGMLGGVLGGPVTPNSIGSPIAQGNIDTNAFRTLGDSFQDNAPPKWMGTEIKMEDDEEESDDDDVDELEEVDMEDVEEEEGDEDEDMEDEEEEDDEEDMEDEEEDEDMEDEKHHHTHHKHEDEHEEEHEEEHEKETCEKCGAMYMKKDNCMKCGSYMKEEGVSYSRIPSLEEWQKSVASMYDPKFFDKNYDGISNINEALGSNVQKALTKADAAAERMQSSKSNTLKLAVETLKNLHKQFKRMNPNLDFNGIKKLINQSLAAADKQISKEEDLQKED